MKRFWVFLYDHQCPGGGLFDFAGSFKTIEKAKSQSSNIGSFREGHIYDSSKNKVVYHLARKPEGGAHWFSGNDGIRLEAD